MPDTQRKPMTLRLPAIVARARERGARWWAWPLLDDAAAEEQLGVYATSERWRGGHWPSRSRSCCAEPAIGRSW